jgi:putative component of membrane protein insertase Oxa1/YidC/SpoIIIJ protein YidD
MDSFEINVEDKLRPSVERSLTGTTKLDTEISLLPVPEGNRFKRWGVLMLRKYREIAPPPVRARCVFEPSCSHYSELAVRQHGLVKGLFLTLKRLNRCKSGNGGIDLRNIKMEKSNEI